ncbi:DUF805 domain-containing protein [Leucobacter iarius]|uniref:DUF805 domain-containing protein n=1 Tax=Leucobacter iarius TaxID=333963 RepID=A0ABP4XK51_9MICO
MTFPQSPTTEAGPTRLLPLGDARDRLDGAAAPNQLDRPLYGATFGQAFVRLFRGFARFTGRSSPSEFWWGILVLAILRIFPYLLFLPIVFIGSGLDPYDPVSPAVNIGLNIAAMYAFLLMLAVALGSLIPLLSITWRRLQDANLAGPLALLMLLPVLGQIAVLVMVLTSSNPAGRRFDRAVFAGAPPVQTTR